MYVRIRMHVCMYVRMYVCMYIIYYVDPMYVSKHTILCRYVDTYANNNYY